MNFSASRELLDEYSCVITIGDKQYKYVESGVKPLLQQISLPEMMQGAFVCDRVIGKAAALLMVYGGACEVYTRVISVHAQKVFESYGIKCNADKVVEYIINRSGDGMCPMEQLCLDIDLPEDAYVALLKKVASFNK